MFDFQKLCDRVEDLSPADRGVLLVQTAADVVGGLRRIDLQGADPVDVLVSVLIGSVVSDGVVSEKDYLAIYPSLAKAFGDVCDLAGIQHAFKVSKDVRKEIANDTGEMLKLISSADDALGSSIILLCLLVTSVDGKISLKEKRYIRQLCRA